VFLFLRLCLSLFFVSFVSPAQPLFSIRVVHPGFINRKPGEGIKGREGITRVTKSNFISSSE